MHISKYKESNIPSLKEGVEIIKSNYQVSFIWILVKNNQGNLMELGGRNNENGLHLKVYIPKYKEDGIPFTNQELAGHDRSNDFAASSYSIEHDEVYNTSAIEYPSAFTRKKLFKDAKDFVKYINKRNFQTNPIKLESRIAYQEPVHEYYPSNFKNV